MIDAPSATTLAFAFGLTCVAGLSTGVGSALAFFTKHTNVRFLSIAMGFSAGVMIYVRWLKSFRKHALRYRTTSVSATTTG
jgi:ZIP family zinc transporter